MENVTSNSGMPVVRGNPPVPSGGPNAPMPAAPKKKMKKWPFILIGVILIVLVGGFFWLRSVVGNMANGMISMPEEFMVEEGDLTASIAGSGRLEDNKTEVKLPEGLSIERKLVSDGDIVRAGDPIATVNAAALQARIDAVRKDLNETNDAIANLVKGKTQAVQLRAPSAGRIKAIYVGAGDSVMDAVTSSGALMLISLDGKMAVSIETETPLNRGAKVAVSLPGGTTVEGTVESATEKGYVITISDNGPKPGDQVTVTADSAAVGNGVLTVHSPLKVQAPAGTVNKVFVSENTKVSVGTALMSLNVPTTSGNYDSLTEKRDKLAEQLESLISLTVNNTVYAPVNGKISRIGNGGSNSGSGSGEGNGDNNAASGGDANDFSGESGASGANTGGGTSSGSSTQEVITIIAQDSIALVVNINEMDIAAVKEGMAALVEINAVKDETFEGTVSKIEDKLNTDTGLMEYKATIILDRNDAMKSGMSASATLIKDEAKGALIIPLDAVQENETGSFVYTEIDEKGNLLSEVEIETGLSDGNNVVVTSGLSAGDVIYYFPLKGEDEMIMPYGGMMF